MKKSTRQNITELGDEYAFILHALRISLPVIVLLSENAGELGAYHPIDGRTSVPLRFLVTASYSAYIQLVVAVSTLS